MSGFDDIHSDSTTSIIAKDRIDYSIDVSVFEAKNLNVLAEADIFTILKVNDTELFETQKVLSLEPFWGENHLLMLDDTFRSLTLTVYQKKVDPKALDSNSSVRKSAKKNYKANNSVVAKQNKRERAKIAPTLAIGTITFPGPFVQSQTKMVENWYTLNPKPTEVSGFIEIRTRYVDSLSGPVLTLYLQCARDLSTESDPNRLCDVFATICPIPTRSLKDYQKTVIFEKNNNPNYQQTFEFKLGKETEALYIMLWDNQKHQADFLGEVVIPVADFEAIGLTNKLTVHRLKPKPNFSTLAGGNKPHEFSSSFVTGKCNYCNETMNGLKVLKCKECKIAIHVTCQAYVGKHCQLENSIKSLQKKYQELASFKKLSNIELHVLQFQDFHLHQLQSDNVPKREVKPHSLAPSACWGAICRVCYKGVTPQGLKCRQCGHVFHDACSDKAVSICGLAGQLRFKFKYMEERILEVNEYMDFYDLINQGGLYLLGLLNQVTREADDVAKALIRASYGNSQSDLRLMLRRLAKLDLDKLTDYNTIFRGNSLTTKSFDNFLKIFGKSYLVNVLQPIIDEILNADSTKSCELDPMRVDKSDDIDGYKANLIYYVNKLMIEITGHPDKIPLEIRGVLKDLREEVVDATSRLGATDDDPPKYIGVTAFLFLRFFCAAIFNPQLFWLMEGIPGEKTKRNFALVAKTIQSIANLSEYAGDKEPYMTVLNTFISSQFIKMKAFVDIATVEPKYEDIAAKQILTPTKMDTAKELSRLCRYFAHHKQAMIELAENENATTPEEKELLSRLWGCLDVLHAKHQTEPKQRCHSFTNFHDTKEKEKFVDNSGRPVSMSVKRATSTDGNKQFTVSEPDLIQHATKILSGRSKKPETSFVANTADTTPFTSQSSTKPQSPLSSPIQSPTGGRILFKRENRASTRGKKERPRSMLGMEQEKEPSIKSPSSVSTKSTDTKSELLESFCSPPFTAPANTEGSRNKNSKFSFDDTNNNSDTSNNTSDNDGSNLHDTSHKSKYRTSNRWNKATGIDTTSHGFNDSFAYFNKLVASSSNENLKNPRSSNSSSNVNKLTGTSSAPASPRTGEEKIDINRVADTIVQDMTSMNQQHYVRSMLQKQEFERKSRRNHHQKTASLSIGLLTLEQQAENSKLIRTPISAIPSRIDPNTGESVVASRSISLVDQIEVKKEVVTPEKLLELKTQWLKDPTSLMPK